MNELQSKKRNDLEEQFGRRYSIELFFYNLPQLALVFASVFLVAFILDKYIEAVVFLISFFTLRYKFDTTFHYENVIYCILTTILMFTMSVILSPPITVSLFGCILFGFFDTWLLWFIQDRFEFKLQAKILKEYSKQLEKEVEELLTKINHKDIYAMNENELYEHCRNCGLDDNDCKIAYFVIIERLKGKELYDAIGYSERQTKRKRTKILNIIDK
jgi:accessory gene regulator protein AgrB